MNHTTSIVVTTTLEVTNDSTLALDSQPLLAAPVSLSPVLPHLSASTNQDNSIHMKGEAASAGVSPVRDSGTADVADSADVFVPGAWDDPDVDLAAFVASHEKWKQTVCSSHPTLVSNRMPGCPSLTLWITMRCSR